MNLEIREKNEAEMFDNEVLVEFGIKRIEELTDRHLKLEEARINMHLGFKAPPNRPYRFALYLLQNLAGKKVLDYCAGTGATTVLIAKKRPARVESFDISPLAVRVAKMRMKANNVADIANPRVASAYSMDYPDNHFDIVYGNAVLHHLDLDIAMKEVRRVLKPGGTAVFCEPFAGSSNLQRIRNLVPIKGDLSPHERQLNPADIKVISGYFSRSEIYFFGLFSRLDKVIKSNGALDLISSVDENLLKTLPFLKKFSRTAVFRLTK